jgi:hypothetical protein
MLSAKLSSFSSGTEEASHGQELLAIGGAGVRSSLGLDQGRE